MDQSFSLTEEERLLRAFRRAREAALKKKADDASTGAGNNNTAEASVTAAFARSFVLLMGEPFFTWTRLETCWVQDKRRKCDRCLFQETIEIVQTE